MRRMHCGWETGDFTMWSASVAATHWSIAADAAAARSGGFGLKVSRPAAAGTTTGAYLRHAFVTEVSPVIMRPAGFLAADENKPLCKTNDMPSWCSARIYHKPLTVPTSNSVYIHLMGFAVTGSDTRHASIGIRCAGGGPPRYFLDVGGTQVDIYTPTVGAGAPWYRLVLEGGNTSEAGVTGIVYDELGTTPLGMKTLNTGPASPADRIIVGCAAATISSNFAQEHHLDDFAVNDNAISLVSPRGIHTAEPWFGRVTGLLHPTGAGDFAQFIPVGSLNNWENVNEWPPNDADYNDDTAVVAVDCRDSHLMTDVGGIPRAAAVIAKIDNAGGDFGHAWGLRVNGTEVEVQHNPSAAIQYVGCVAGEKDGGGPWTATKLSDAQLSYRRLVGVTNSHRFIAIAAEVEDNSDGENPAELAGIRPGELHPATYPPGVVAYGETRGTRITPPVTEA